MWRPTEGNTLGVETAILEGNPAKPGYYLTVNHFPKDVMSRPHYHPDERYCIVLRGTWYTDEGEVFRPNQAVPLKPGDFMRHPKGGPHYDGALDVDIWLAISGHGPDTGHRHRRRRAVRTVSIVPGRRQRSRARISPVRCRRHKPRQGPLLIA